MPVNPRSEARIEAFLGELAKRDVKASHRSRSIYRINDKRVSVRTTTKPGPQYWYDVSESIMNGVEYLVYQTDSSRHFVLFPVSLFKQHYSNFKDSNRSNAKQFYIDLRQKKLVSGPLVSINVHEYFCSLSASETPGPWRHIFLNEEIS